MIERIEGIVTEIIRHTDRHNVVILYTRSRGRMAFLVPVGKSKTGRMRNAMLSYLAVWEADVNIRGNKELYTLHNIRPARLWKEVYSNPIKSSLLFFLTEFCNKLLRQYPADGRLWDFIVASMERLESLPVEKIANFHLTFLIRMLPIVGIEPAVDGWEPGKRFDVLSGEMTDSGNPSFLRRTVLLSEEESSLIPKLMRMNFRNMTCFRMRQQDRRELLQHLIEYYTIHLPLNSDFKTLEVLSELF